MKNTYNADYLVVGAGASAMAFVDVLLSETSASVIMIDKEDKPGGHWNHAYSFVTLHQPSTFYGVSSKELSKGLKDKIGLNKGLHELASGNEIKAYYDDLMRERFLPSGKVQYFPKCEYLGDGKVRSLLTGQQFNVGYNKKRVDSTYFKTSVPATHTPVFEIESGVTLIPPNGLSGIEQPLNGVTIIGGGKTGIDTCLWLLERGINPDTITWIMPRDGWLIDRENTQPSNEFFLNTIGAQASQMEAAAESQSIEDLFLRLEQKGVHLRIDTDVMPTMFHGATISKLELEALRKVKNIVRLGRVKTLGLNKVVLEKGKLEAPEQQIYVDCTASAITNLETVDVFRDDLITLQTVRAYQPTFSAAFIAHIEATYDDIGKKNDLTRVVPLPNQATDWIEMTYRNMMNQYFWSKEPGLKNWMKDNRLDGFSHMVNSVRFYELGKLKVLNRLRKAIKPAMAKLKAYKNSLNEDKDKNLGKQQG